MATNHVFNAIFRCRIAMDESIRKKLARFRNEEPHSASGSRVGKTTRKLDSKLLVLKKKVRQQANPLIDHETSLKDLQPSLDENLVVVFIGFNPGIQSSIQQHHYAHHSNLFWKLFNQAEILQCVLEHLGWSQDDYPKWLDNGVSTLKPSDDFDLIKCKIGFTDLVLRCTKEALELSMEEKMANVPRLILEFSRTKVENIVVVGKGIWEIIVKYVSQSIGLKIKLTKTNFAWGIQEDQGKDPSYRQVLRALCRMVGHECRIFVFPNTSGLVTTMKFDEKLQLWTKLGDYVKIKHGE